MKVRVVITGIALTVLGVFIPLVGWFLLLPAGLIVIVVGLILKEEIEPVKPATAETAGRSEDVLLDVDLVITEMEAIARRMPQLSQEVETSVELADQYAACLKDAESKTRLARHLENSLNQIIRTSEQELEAAESSVSDLERSKEVYGIQSESLDTKIVRETARRDELRANLEKQEGMLSELRAKREQLSLLAGKGLGTVKPEKVGLYARVLIMYKEKYGEAAEKKLKRDLTLGGRSLEEIHDILRRQRAPEQTR